MKTIFNIIVLALLIPAISYCNSDLNGRHTKTKKASKSYNVSATDMLTIDNSYGNVDISTWNQNKVVIEVNIKTNGDDEEKVQKKLDELPIEFDT